MWILVGSKAISESQNLNQSPDDGIKIAVLNLTVQIKTFSLVKF